SQAFKNFLARKSHQRHQGRAVAAASGMRKHERYESCLEVTFDNFPDLAVEYASNLSRGGLFAKTYAPPPVRTRVQLTVRLPNGESVGCEAEVVHAISVEEALARGVA